MLAIAAVPQYAAAETKSFTLTAERTLIPLGSGLKYKGWTYSGTVPGPVLRVRQGDEVKIHLMNKTSDAHGIDIHAAQILPEKFMGKAGQSVTYSFRAEVPGVFAYHCSAPPVLDHIARGMYGMIIVEPTNGWPTGPAQDITLVQSEFYGLPNKKGVIVGNEEKMVNGQPDFIVYNGRIRRYDKNHPIPIKVDKLVRVFFMNAGPNLMSIFHVSGVLFSNVYTEGNPANRFQDEDSFVVGPSQTAIFEFKVHEPGDYEFMDMDRQHQYKGADGIFRATR